VKLPEDILKKIVEELEQEDILAQKLELTLELGDRKAIHQLLLFTHNHANRNACSNGYFIGRRETRAC
jgi:hypothetical protein